MTTGASANKESTGSSQWIKLAKELGLDFASRVAQHDAESTFVMENYETMRQKKLFSAAVPSELGGGGASHAEICAVIRELAHYDGSTALAFSMHSHLLAALIWRHRHGATPPAEPLLRRIATEELVLVKYRRVRLARRVGHRHQGGWWLSYQGS